MGLYNQWNTGLSKGQIVICLEDSIRSSGLGPDGQAAGWWSVTFWRPSLLTAYRRRTRPVDGNCGGGRPAPVIASELAVLGSPAMDKATKPVENPDQTAVLARSSKWSSVGGGHC